MIDRPAIMCTLPTSARSEIPALKTRSSELPIPCPANTLSKRGEPRPPRTGRKDGLDGVIFRGLWQGTVSWGGSFRGLKIMPLSDEKSQ